ncbi:MAG: MarR family transcriptional regulator [Pyrinomonadaceae bacterium]|nr:MarR family transcriptional regulator [Pyrinomonadaceae bacterium]
MFGILDAIARKEPLSQKALGELRNIDRTTTVAYVDQLETLGLIKRENNLNDRREHALVMTADGVKTVSQARDAARMVEKRFLQNLKTEDCHKLLEILWRLFQTQDGKNVVELPDKINSLCDVEEILQ